MTIHPTTQMHVTILATIHPNATAVFTATGSSVQVGSTLYVAGVL